MPDLSTTPRAIFVRSTLEFTAREGWSNVELYEGTEDQCRSELSISLARGAHRTRLSPKGDGAWALEATFTFNAAAPNGEGNFVDTQELEVSAHLESWTRSWLYRARFSDYIASTRDSAHARDTIAVIGDCSRKYLAGQPAPEADGLFRYPPKTGTVYPTREKTIEAELAARLSTAKLGYTLSDSEFLSAYQLFTNVAYRGVTGFLEYNQVFRRTVTAGSPQAIAANRVGAGMVWTTAELVAWEGIPNDGFFDLPPDSSWHKDKPRVLAAYGQKTQITYSYTEIVTASALFYQAYGSAALIDT